MPVRGQRPNWGVPRDRNRWVQCQQRSFTFTSYDSRGVITTLRAAADSGKWVWPVGPSNRVVWEQLSPSAYAFRIEALQPSGEWRVVDRGRYDKIRPR